MGFDHALGRSRMPAEHGRRPDRAGSEIASAVWTDSPETLVGALGAERALVGADAGLDAVGRQVAIAAFAIGAQFEHWREPRAGWFET